MNHGKPELSGKEVDFKVKIEIPFSYLQNIGLTKIYLQVFYQIIIYFLIMVSNCLYKRALNLKPLLYSI